MLGVYLDSPADAQRVVTTTTMNLMMHHRGIDTFRGWLAREVPDVLALQEFPTAWRGPLRELADAYPHGIVLPAPDDPRAATWFAIGLFTRLPVVSQRIVEVIVEVEENLRRCSRSSSSTRARAGRSARSARSTRSRRKHPSCGSGATATSRASPTSPPRRRVRVGRPHDPPRRFEHEQRLARVVGPRRCDGAAGLAGRIRLAADAGDGPEDPGDLDRPRSPLGRERAARARQAPPDVPGSDHRGVTARLELVP
jgi:hypothetical protein